MLSLVLERIQVKNFSVLMPVLAKCEGPRFTPGSLNMLLGARPCLP